MTIPDPPELTDEELDDFLDAGDAELLEYVRGHADPTRTLTALMAITDDVIDRGAAPERLVSLSPADVIAGRLQIRHLIGGLKRAIALLYLIEDASLLFVSAGSDRMDEFRCQARVLRRALSHEPPFGHLDDHLRELAVAHDAERLRYVAQDLADRVVFIVAHGLPIDVDGTEHFHREMNRVRAGADQLGRLLLVGYDADPFRVRDRVRDLTYGVTRVLDAARELDPSDGEIIASGADLSRLSVPDVEVLVGVVWDRDTRWPSGLRELVAARSMEISPGVYRVAPGGNERDPQESLSR